MFYKIVVFAPEKSAAKIRKALGEAGAGRIGNYSFCTFSTKGIGRFKPLKGAMPTIGKINKVEAVHEIRIETICSQDKLEKVLQAIKEKHPYEEPAVDVYELKLPS